jgi:hypothetical protein
VTAVNVTDERLAEAVRNSLSWTQALRLMGFAGSVKTKQRAAVAGRASLLGLDTRHLDHGRPGPRVSWTIEQLEEAVASSKSVSEVCRKLKTHHRGVNAAIKTLELKTEHFNDHFGYAVDPFPAEPIPETGLREAAESLAAGWYALRGYSVFVQASSNQSYDLVVLKDSAIKVQVKSTNCRMPRGWSINVARTGRSSDWTPRPYAAGDFDELFVVTGDGRYYRLPASTAVGKNSLLLTSGYDRYLVDMFN